MKDLKPRQTPATFESAVVRKMGQHYLVTATEGNRDETWFVRDYEEACYVLHTLLHGAPPGPEDDLKTFLKAFNVQGDE